MEYKSVFDDDTGQFIILLNDRNEYSLWPLTVLVPAGWNTVFGPASRQECLDYVKINCKRSL